MLHKKRRCSFLDLITLITTTVFMCGQLSLVHADTFDYGFKTVFDSNADQYLVSQENVKKFPVSFAPPVNYWGPSLDGIEGVLTYKFDFAQPSQSISMKASLNVWDFVRFGQGYGGRGWGSASIWASADGNDYELLLDSPRPDSLGGGGSYDGELPNSLLGSDNLWVQVKMLSNGAPLSSYAVAQFSRVGIPNNGDNVFELNVLTSPEPNSITLLWNQSGPGTFGYETAANWAPNATPTTDNDVVFAMDGDVDVIPFSTSVAKNVTFSDGVVRLKSFGNTTFTSLGSVTVDDPLAANLAGGAFATLDGTNGHVWTTSLDLNVGNTGFGTFTVNNGADFDAQQILVGNQAGAEGQLTVTDIGTLADSLVSVSGDLIVGNLGQGTLSVFDGGRVESETAMLGRQTGADGTAHVGDGNALANWNVAGSLYVGGSDTQAGGTGLLNINSQGSVHVGDELKIWDNGTVVLDSDIDSLLVKNLTRSAGSQFNFVGGKLSFVNNAANNRVLDSSALSDIFNADHTLSPGKILEIGGPVTLSAPLRLDGGTFSVSSVVPGTETAFRANLGWITGELRFTSTDLNVLDSSALSDIFNADHTLSPGKILEIGGPVTLSAPLRLDGGTFSVSSVVPGTETAFRANLGWITGELRFTSTDLNIGAAGPLGPTVNMVPGQTLVVTGGGLVNDGDLNVIGTTVSFAGGPSVNNAGAEVNAINATLTFDGDLTNNGDVNLINTTVNGSLINGGTGALAMIGSNAFSDDLDLGGDDNLYVDISDSAPGEFDTLSVGGEAALDGSLNVSFVSNFSPSAGDSFEIITAASMLGVFDTVSLPALPGDLLWFVNYNATSVELVSTFGADFDEDGNVDDNDLAAWENGFGSTTATHMTGDANTDAAANGFDFLAWQRQVGSGVAIAAANTAVPEPSTLLLSVLSLAAGSIRCRRHNRA